MTWLAFAPSTDISADDQLAGQQPVGHSGRVRAKTDRREWMKQTAPKHALIEKVSFLAGEGWNEQNVHGTGQLPAA